MKFTKNLQTDFKETRQFSRSSSLKPYLSDVFSLAYEKNDRCVATLSAPRAITYDLENSRAWFENACGKADVRTFLDRAIENNDSVYLVVGFRTVSDGSLVKELKNTKDKGVRLQAPLSILPAGIASPTLAANIPDPGIRSTHEVKDSQELSFTAPGEQIFAVLYRKVKFRWLSRKTVGNMALEANNRWKSVWDWRGPDAGDGDPGIVEATLADVDDMDISDEESESDADATDYVRERSVEERVPHTSIPSHSQSTTTDGPVAQLTQRLFQYEEAVAPSLNISSYLREHHGKPEVSVSHIPAVGQSVADQACAAMLELLRVKYWCSLILFACLLGGLPIPLAR